MLIDPFTVGAQILNFLILVWLLKRWLYGPIMRAMAAREARIREELDAASRLRDEAEAEGARYRELIAGVEAEQEERRAEVRAELEAWRREHTQAVRTEVEAMRERWQQALQQEKEAFLLELRTRAGHAILDVARRTLRDLADRDIEEHVTSRFLTEVRALTEDERTQLVDAAREADRRVHVRTAYHLDETDRSRLRAALADLLGDELDVEFGTTPELVAGVELRAGGYKVAWSIGEYLRSLEDTLGETFGQRQEPAHGRR